MNNQKKSNILAEVIELLKIVLFSFIFVFILTNYFIKPIRVDGSSMYPTLHHNDIGFSNIIGLKLNGIQRFDVVIVYVEDTKEYLVKRVVGLPNETLEIKNDILYIDNQAIEQSFLDKDYVNSQSINGVFTSDVEKIQLQENEYYLMGDNRPHSSDSRYYGPFTKKSIIGKDAVILFPFNNIGIH